jgi:hypothetical protein
MINLIITVIENPLLVVPELIPGDTDCDGFFLEFSNQTGARARFQCLEGGYLESTSLSLAGRLFGDVGVVGLCGNASVLQVGVRTLKETTRTAIREGIPSTVQNLLN